MKGVVELDGGWVEACSSGEGRGAEFVIDLPLAPATASSDSRST